MSTSRVETIRRLHENISVAHSITTFLSFVAQNGGKCDDIKQHVTKLEECVSEANQVWREWEEFFAIQPARVGEETWSSYHEAALSWAAETLLSFFREATWTYDPSLWPVVREFLRKNPSETGVGLFVEMNNEASQAIRTAAMTDLAGAYPNVQATGQQTGQTKKKLPENDKVIEAARRLADPQNVGRSKIDICREITDSEKEAQTIAAQLKPSRHGRLLSDF